MASEIKAVVKLEDGNEIRLKLYPEVAPITVKNFIGLCAHKFYDGLCFHRVIPDFMVQGGGFVDKGGKLIEKHAPKSIRGEFRLNGFDNPLSHKPGVISMARTNVPDSASSQFFICTADCKFLDGQYAAFGECEDKESIAVAVGISKVGTHSVGYYDDVPIKPVIIKTIEITENAVD